MKAIIHYESKRVDVGLPTLADAGWAGFNFAMDNPDLVEQGWRLWYFSTSDSRFGRPDAFTPRDDMDTVVDRIRRGTPCPHSCPQHEALT